MPVCSVNCEALQDLGILTFALVHDASATSKHEYLVK